MNQDTDEYTEPPEEVLREMERTLTLKVTSARAILDALHHMDEFLRCYASPAVRAELRAYCTAQGWSAICGSDAFIDTIGFTAATLRWAIDTTTDHAGNAAGADHDDKETT
jgi:hypothetical protein